jgi:hypothetical protein
VIKIVFGNLKRNLNLNLPKRKKFKMVDTDGLVGAAAGLLAVGIMANVAGKMLQPNQTNASNRKLKTKSNKKIKDSFW